MLIPVASRLLFHPALQGMHAALMGISGALISMIWAMIPPLDQSSKFVGDVPLDYFAHIYLPFINTARAMFCVVFALIAWELFITYPNTQKTQGTKVSLHNLLPFIWIVVPCFLMLGITEFVLNAPELSFSFSFYKLYANVALAGILLSFGLWVNKKGEHSLQWILAITLLLLPIAAMGLVLPFTPKAPSAIVLIIGIKMQTFICILACGLFSLRCNRPQIAIWLGLLTPALSMLSQLGMQQLAFILSEEMFGKILFTILTLFAALSLAGLPFVARACQNMFEDSPLPDKQEFKDEEFTHEALQPRPYRSEKITEFSEKYRLSNREVQILEMLAQGLSSSEMAYQINLRESTVRTYAQGLLRKTGAKSRLLLVAALAAEDECPLEQQEPSLE
ncbi:response regulator transcription factor [Desulfovibrio cuneatus]|uniref:response regulator transcription factor n=1 Tax=Desulfovibrio cuneatus TaxID=159728 RepID=UPI00146FB679|nr:helix-turn-helix transcriptional regulator [Desulfovibrio cuneatus]